MATYTRGRFQKPAIPITPMTPGSKPKPVYNTGGLILIDGVDLNPANQVPNPAYTPGPLVFPTETDTGTGTQTDAEKEEQRQRDNAMTTLFSAFQEFGLTYSGLKWAAKSTEEIHQMTDVINRPGTYYSKVPDVRAFLQAVIKDAESGMSVFAAVEKNGGMKQVQSALIPVNGNNTTGTTTPATTTKSNNWLILLGLGALVYANR